MVESVLELRAHDYDLELTLYPSFITTTFRKVRDYEWIKVFGSYRGLALSQRGDVIVVRGPADERAAYRMTGLWYEPERYLIDVSSDLIDVCELLVQSYSKIRIAVNPYDDLYMFMSVFLSRNTDYHVNVMRWVQRILEVAEDRPENVLRVRAEDVGRSYQLRQLHDALVSYINVMRKLSIDDVWSIRRELLKIRNVGPKVVDAYLIFTGRSTLIAPSDKHFIRFARGLRMFSECRPPNKRHCLRVTCCECPMRSRCLTGLSHVKLGRLSAWVQTVSYVVDKLFCSRALCSTCALLKCCSRKQI